jgi:hypothetical protein
VLRIRALRIRALRNDRAGARGKRQRHGLAARELPVCDRFHTCLRGDAFMSHRAIVALQFFAGLPLPV